MKVVHYKSWWDRNKEWSIDLPRGEFAKCVVASSTWVAVATSTRVIRVFTTSGQQIQIFSIPGEPLTLAANQVRSL